MMELIVEHPHVPYIGHMLGTFTPEKCLKIRGIVPLTGFRFNIRLQCSGEIIIQNNVALQLSVNLQNNNISLNSKQNGKWDEAQTVVGVPIKYEERFELAITCDFSHYKIFFNSNQYCEFPQRVTNDRISHVIIDGDISIEQISYESEISSLEALLSPIGFKYDEAPPPYNETQSKTPPIYASNFDSSSLLAPSMPSYSITTLPQYSPYPVGPGMYTVGTETTVQQNETSSNFHFVLSSNHKKCSVYICLLVLLSVLIGASLLTKPKS